MSDIGRYVVVRTGGFPAWVIRRATHSPYNHAFIIVSDEGDIVEAQPGGVVKSHISRYKGCQAAWNEHENYLPDEAEAVAQKALSLVGVPYNDIDIVELGLESLGHPWNWLAKIAAGDGELICSQLVVVCGKAGLMNWQCGKPTPADVTPGDLGRRPYMVPYTI
jgi:uncharacterized protein YycO